MWKVQHDATVRRLVVEALQTRPSYRKEAHVHTVLGFLKSSSSLDRFSPQALLELARSATFRQCKAGEVPFEFDRDEMVAVILSGSVAVFKDDILERALQQDRVRGDGKASSRAQELGLVGLAMKEALKRRDEGNFGKLMATLQQGDMVNKLGLQEAEDLVSMGSRIQQRRDKSTYRSSSPPRRSPSPERRSGSPERRRGGISFMMRKMGNMVRYHNDDDVLLAQSGCMFLAWNVQTLQDIIARDRLSRHLSYSFDQAKASLSKAPNDRVKFELSFLADYLAQFRVFQLFPREVLLHLASTSLHFHTASPGTILFERGQYAESLFCVLRGGVAVCLPDEPIKPIDDEDSSAGGDGARPTEILEWIANSGTPGVMPDGQPGVPTGSSRKAVDLPGVAVCVLEPGNLAGEEFLTQSEMTVVTKIDEDALALQARLAMAMHAHTQDGSAEVHSEIMRRKELFSRRHAASGIAVSAVDYVTVTEQGLRAAMEAVKAAKLTSAAAASGKDVAQMSLQALLQIHPSKRSPNHIAHMIQRAAEGSLRHLMRRMNTLTRARIMERATLKAFSVGDIICEQGTYPPAMCIPLVGSLSLFEQTDALDASLFGAEFVEEHDDLSSSEEEEAGDMPTAMMFEQDNLTSPLKRVDRAARRSVAPQRAVHQVKQVTLHSLTEMPNHGTRRKMRELLRLASNRNGSGRLRMKETATTAPTSLEAVQEVNRVHTSLARTYKAAGMEERREMLARKWGALQGHLTVGDSCYGEEIILHHPARFTAVASVASDLKATVNGLDSSSDMIQREAAGRLVHLKHRRTVCLWLDADDVLAILGTLPQRLCLTPNHAAELLTQPPETRTAAHAELISRYMSTFRYFYSMQPSYMHVLSRIMVRRCVPKGTALCEEGELGQTFFVILSGLATAHSLHHPLAGTSTHRYGAIIGTLSAGDAIGAPADSVISDPNAWHHVRTSTVVASTAELEVVSVSLIDFLQYLRFGVAPGNKAGDATKENYLTDRMPAGCHEALHKAPELRSTHDHANVVTFLQQLPLYNSIPRRALALLAPHVTLVSVNQGAAVVKEGDDGSDMYIVIEGGVTVHVQKTARPQHAPKPPLSLGDAAMRRKRASLLQRVLRPQVRRPSISSTHSGTSTGDSSVGDDTASASSDGTASRRSPSPGMRSLHEEQPPQLKVTHSAALGLSIGADQMARLLRNGSKHRRLSLQSVKGGRVDEEEEEISPEDHADLLLSPPVGNSFGAVLSQHSFLRTASRVRQALRSEVMWYGGNTKFHKTCGRVVGVLRAGDTFGESALEMRENHQRLATVIAMTKTASLLKLPGEALRRAVVLAAATDNVFMLANVIGTKNVVRNVHNILSSSNGIPDITEEQRDRLYPVLSREVDPATLRSRMAASQLSKMPQLATLPNEHLMDMARSCRFMTFAPGELCMEVNTPAAHVQVLISGTVKTTLPRPNMKRLLPATKDGIRWKGLTCTGEKSRQQIPDISISKLREGSVLGLVESLMNPKCPFLLVNVVASSVARVVTVPIAVFLRYWPEALMQQEQQKLRFASVLTEKGKPCPGEDVQASQPTLDTPTSKAKTYWLKLAARVAGALQRKFHLTLLANKAHGQVHTQRLQRIAAVFYMTRRHKYDRGQVIVKEGQVMSSIHVVKHGECSAVVETVLPAGGRRRDCTIAGASRKSEAAAAKQVKLMAVPVKATHAEPRAGNEEGGMGAPFGLTVHVQFDDAATVDDTKVVVVPVGPEQQPSGVLVQSQSGRMFRSDPKRVKRSAAIASSDGIRQPAAPAPLKLASERVVIPSAVLCGGACFGWENTSKSTVTATSATVVLWTVPKSTLRAVLDPTVMDKVVTLMHEAMQSRSETHERRIRRVKNVAMGQHHGVEAERLAESDTFITQGMKRNRPPPEIEGDEQVMEAWRQFEEEVKRPAFSVKGGTMYSHASKLPQGVASYRSKELRSWREAFYKRTMAAARVKRREKQAVMDATSAALVAKIEAGLRTSSAAAHRRRRMGKSVIASSDDKRRMDEAERLSQAVMNRSFRSRASVASRQGSIAPKRASVAVGRPSMARRSAVATPAAMKRASMAGPQMAAPARAHAAKARAMPAAPASAPLSITQYLAAQILPNGTDQEEQGQAAAATAVPEQDGADEEGKRVATPGLIATSFAPLSNSTSASSLALRPSTSVGAAAGVKPRPKTASRPSTEAMLEHVTQRIHAVQAETASQQLAHAVKAAEAPVVALPESRKVMRRRRPASARISRSTVATPSLAQPRPHISRPPTPRGYRTEERPRSARVIGERLAKTQSPRGFTEKLYSADGEAGSDAWEQVEYEDDGMPQVQEGSWVDEHGHLHADVDAVLTAEDLMPDQSRVEEPLTIEPAHHTRAPSSHHVRPVRPAAPVKRPRKEHKQRWLSPHAARMKQQQAESSRRRGRARAAKGRLTSVDPQPPGDTTISLRYTRTNVLAASAAQAGFVPVLATPFSGIPPASAGVALQAARTAPAAMRSRPSSASRSRPPSSRRTVRESGKYPPMAVGTLSCVVYYDQDRKVYEQREAAEWAAKMQSQRVRDPPPTAYVA